MMGTSIGVLADSLAAWLLTYAAHSTVLLGAVALLTRHRRFAGPVLQDTLWKTAILGGLLTATLRPIAGLPHLSLAAHAALPGAAPTEPAPIPPRTAHRAATGAATEAATAAAPEMPPLAIEIPTEPMTHAVAPAGDAASAPTSASAPSHWRMPSIPAPSPVTAVVALWALVAGVAALRLALARRGLARRFGRRVPVGDPALLADLAALATAAGHRRPVQLTAAAGLASPVALGTGEICLPHAVLVELDRDQQRSVLAHELAHLIRRDPWWLAAAVLVERVFFFQPLNRLARRRMQEAAEYLCDDWAVRRTGSGLTLAKSLVRVAEWLQAEPAAVPLAGMAENPSQLVCRVRRLVEEAPMTRTLLDRWRLPVAGGLVLLTALAVPGIGVGLAASQGTPADTARPGAPTPTPRPARPSRPAVAGARSTVSPEPMISVDAAAIAAEASSAAQIDAERLARQAAHLDAAVRVDTHVDVARLQRMASRIAARVAGRTPQDTAGRGRSVEVLIQAMADKDAGVRAAAAHSLGELGDPRAARALGGAVRDGSLDVRRNAVWALGQIEDSSAVEPLLAVLHDGDAEVRQSAAHSLGNLEDRRAVRPLMTLVADPNADVRQSAVHALGELEDPQAAPALAGALKDANADVRQNAAWALGQLELKAAPAALVEALRDGNREVRKTAAWALSQIQDPKTVPALRGLLSDSDPEVQQNAVHALGEIRTADALDALIDAMRSGSAEVRREAASALGRRD